MTLYLCVWTNRTGEHARFVYAPDAWAAKKVLQEQDDFGAVSTLRVNPVTSELDLNTINFLAVFAEPSEDIEVLDSRDYLEDWNMETYSQPLYRLLITLGEQWRREANDAEAARLQASLPLAGVAS